MNGYNHCLITLFLAEHAQIENASRFRDFTILEMLGMLQRAIDRLEILEAPNRETGIPSEYQF